MENSRRVVLSASVVVCICFFLPWVQLNFVGLSDSVSGYDLAREGGTLLLLLPVLMLAVIAFGLLGFWKAVPFLFSLVCTVGGSLSAYLMYREYSRADRSSALLATQWSPWFWIGFGASIVVAAGAFVFYFRRSRST